MGRLKNTEQVLFKTKKMKKITTLGLLLALFITLASCGKPEDCFIGVEGAYYHCDEHNWIELEAIDRDSMLGVSITTNIKTTRVWIFHNNVEHSSIFTNNQQCNGKKVLSNNWKSGDIITVAVNVNATADEIVLP